AGVTSASQEGDRTEIIASAAEQVVRELLARDISLASLEVMSIGLEDAFIALTRKEEVA
ncbi:MAG: ABC transporter ATP-binding protein, partial [Gemmatimonadaceae bacterium]|nr:ABC transporter ATP-binding protein [Gemmatimonadaceae bacterium]